RLKLREFFNDEEGLQVELRDVPDRGLKYARLVIGELRVFGQAYAQENRNESDIGDNSCVAVRFGDEIRKQFIRACYGYGRVDFYLGLDAPTSCKLAYIHWAKKPTVDDYGVFHFDRYSEHSFVDVRCIDRSVGFVPVDSSATRFELLDREVTAT
ncbi:hypothetical protein HDU96_004003, partial [Phlyctochytrium bullatum]